MAASNCKLESESRFRYIAVYVRVLQGIELSDLPYGFASQKHKITLVTVALMEYLPELTKVNFQARFAELGLLMQLQASCLLIYKLIP